MKNYHIVQPEVIVGLGEDAQFFETQKPFETVKTLHISLDDWLGDDLMECYPCYIITQGLKDGLAENRFTGYEVSSIQTTKSSYFENNYRLNKRIPDFYWLKIVGKKQQHDLFLDNDLRLNLSEQIFSYIKNHFCVQFLKVDFLDDNFGDLFDNVI